MGQIGRTHPAPAVAPVPRPIAFTIIKARAMSLCRASTAIISMPALGIGIQVTGFGTRRPNAGSIMTAIPLALWVDVEPIGKTRRDIVAGQEPHQTGLADVDKLGFDLP